MNSSNNTYNHIVMYSNPIAKTQKKNLSSLPLEVREGLRMARLSFANLATYVFYI
jgi:hypothetical protein